MPRRSQAAVAETRAAVTQAAVDRASVEGLEGLTIGGLAGETEMRKSSVFSLFGSKEELQRAALGDAVERFKREVWVPVADQEAGTASAARPLRQLAGLPPAWGHARGLLPDHRDDRVRRPAWPAPRSDRRDDETVARGTRARGSTAAEAGDLPADIDPTDVAFELNALAAAASYGFQLWRDPEVFDRALRSMRRALGVS